MSELKERILLIAKQRLIGQQAMEKECGLSSGFINKITDKTGVNAIRKIIQTYKVNTHWLVTGEGEMGTPNTTDVIQEDSPESNYILRKNEELRRRNKSLEEKCDKLNRENGVLEGRILELKKSTDV